MPADSPAKALIIGCVLSINEKSVGVISCCQPYTKRMIYVFPLIVTYRFE